MCPPCNRRRALEAAAAAAAAGEPLPPAAPTRRAAEAARRAARASAGVDVVQIAADGGFVVGLTTPARHLPDCVCPNCNRLRAKLRDGEATSRTLDEAASAALPVSPSYATGADDEAASKEALRRARIAHANSGRIPWNAGRRHTPETIAKIAANTRIAMSDPELRARLSQAAASTRHTDNTRAKISAGIRAHLEKRRHVIVEALTAALSYDPRWAVALPGGSWLGPPTRLRLPDSAATAAIRAADAAERAAEADRVARIAERRAIRVSASAAAERDLDAAYADAALREQRARAARGASTSVPSARGAGAPGLKSAAHRAKIAAAIAAKWRNDPSYAERVASGVSARSGARAEADAADAAALGEEIDRDDVTGAGGPPPMRRRRVLSPADRQRRAAMELGARAALEAARAAAEALRAQAAAAGVAVDPALLAEVAAAISSAELVLARVQARGEAEVAAARAASSGRGDAGGAPRRQAGSSDLAGRRRAMVHAKPQGARMEWRQGRLVDVSAEEDWDAALDAAENAAQAAARRNNGW